MNKPMIIAEMSGNHMGSLERALKIIEMAKWAGADSVKIQTYDPDQMVINPGYKLKGGLWDGENLLDLYLKSYTPRSWHKELFDYAKEIGIELFSTPFSTDDVDFLETLNCPRYKVASLEITDLNLIRYIAKRGKPIIISTGGATQNEIWEAIHATNGWIEALMKCTSAYPAPLEDRNLMTMTDMRREFHCRVGLSDHSIGTEDAIIATALGATIIEKHITLEDMKGPDAAFSLTPIEFKLMVAKARYTAKAMGSVQYGPTSNEMVELRRSLYFTRDMIKGELLNSSHVVTARPALGICASRMDTIDNYEMTRDVKAGEPVTEEDISRVVDDTAERV